MAKTMKIATFWQIAREWQNFIKRDPAAIGGIDICFKMRAYSPFSVVTF